MKKLLLMIMITASCVGCIYAQDMNLSTKEQLLLSKMQLKIVGNMNKGGIEYLEKIETNLLESNKKENNKLLPYLLEFLDKQKEYYGIKNEDIEYNKWLEKDTNEISNIDNKKIRNLRVDRVNEERIKRGKNKLEIENKLNWTASVWSDNMMEKIDMTHKRFSTDKYYNFESIKNWFLDKNISFKLINSTMFCENIGVSPFRCYDGNCEEAIIEGLRKGFEMMMDEQFQDYKAHYLTIINGNFKIIGFGLSVDYDKGLVFYTAHYGTELE
ncbi:MAG: CAP domain-containing protein [Candidatus Absconditabacteria bacterium]